MRKQDLFYAAGLFLVLAVSGCAVRTYPLTRDRVDQNLSEGNRGYLFGTSSVNESAGRKTTRTTQIIEVELNSPIKFQKYPIGKKVTPWQKAEEPLIKETAQKIIPEITKFEKYTVQKNDTLQKISQKFYGTAKKWTKIYEANKDILKGPNKIYPSQELKIPLEERNEALKNLK